jgi:hypothetical protein
LRQGRRSTIPATVDHANGDIPVKPAYFWSLVLISAMVGGTGSAYAQQQSDAAKAQPSAQPSATAGTAAPTAAPAPAATPAPAAGPQDAPAAPAPAIVVHFIDAPKATPNVPPADVLKKARDAGYHTKVSHGVVYYCKVDADIGTRFQTEKCLDEDQLVTTLQRLDAARDQLRNNACSGSGCSGK